MANVTFKLSSTDSFELLELSVEFITKYGEYLFYIALGTDDKYHVFVRTKHLSFFVYESESEILKDSFDKDDLRYLYLHFVKKLTSDHDQHHDSWMEAISDAVNVLDILTYDLGLALKESDDKYIAQKKYSKERE